MRSTLLLLFFVALLAAGELVYNETQVYRRVFTPITCAYGEQNVVFLREMRTYNVTTLDAGVEVVTYYATFTLHLKNEGNETIGEFLLKETLPETVAEVPEDITSFSITPYGFEQGSVVVTWLFENVGPGETKSVSYTVEKELDEEVLNEFEKPTIVVAASGAEAPGKQTGAVGFDWTTPVIAVLTLMVAGLIYYFTRVSSPSVNVL